MTSIAQTSPNAFAVADDTGNVIGSIILTTGSTFTAFANGKLVGTYSTMVAAIAAIASAK